MDVKRSATPQVVDNTPAWRRIADDIVASFARGDYEPGAALPPAQDLARAYGVHRHTVRQAFLFVQELGLLHIRRGAGAFFTGRRLPYRIGRRVRLRDNLRGLDLAIVSRIFESESAPCSELVARDLAIKTGAPVWRIGIVNSVGGQALSLSRHYACALRFSDLPERLASNGASFTAAFASYDIQDYERRSTHVTARSPRAQEADLLNISSADPVLATRSIDIENNGAPLQLVEAAFRGDRIELRVEAD